MTIKELRAARNALAKEARNILDKDTGTYDEKRLDEIYAEIDRIDGRIKAEQRLLDLEADEIASSDPDVPVAGAGAAPGPRPGDEVRQIVFDAYLRGGEGAVNRLSESVQNDYARQVQNAQSTGVPSEGGYLVPTTFGGQLLEAMAAFGGVRSVANVVQMESGEPIQWPTVDETAEEGELLAENTTATDGDATFGTTTIGAHMFSSRAIAIPFQLLQDSGITDLDAYVRRLLALRLQRITNRLYTTGTGVAQPQGVSTGAGLGHTTATGMVSSFTFDDIYDLEGSLDPVYRDNASFMFHDDALKRLKKMKDSESRPLWVPGVSGQAPAEVIGYGYTINQHMASPAAGVRSMLFGDFDKYLIRDVRDMMLFRFTDSAYSKKGQVGFLAMMRSDGRVIAADDKAIKAMEQSAT